MASFFIPVVSYNVSEIKSVLSVLVYGTKQQRSFGARMESGLEVV